MKTQTRDVGLSRAELEAYLVRRGYWHSPAEQGNREYVLSPCAYALSSQQTKDLSRLAEKTYAAVRRLNTHVCELATGGRHLSHEDGAFLRLANQAARGLLSPSDGCLAIPPLLKVDLMQDAFGKFHIAEVDVYNSRGLGYNALLEESLRPRAGFCFERFLGVGGFHRLLAARGSEWLVIVSESERYYETAFRIFADSLQKYDARGLHDHGDLKVRMVRDREVAEGIVSIPDNANVLIIPDTMDRYPQVRDMLMTRYRAGTLRTFYPPVAYLGSKAFLPFLRSCDGMEEFIPPTALVGKKWSDPGALVDVSRPTVLKAAVSSGLKGVLFSDLDADRYATQLREASQQKNGCCVLQQQVSQTPVSVVVFGDKTGERREVRDYYVRITAQVSERGIVDVEVTGCLTRKVHGGSECIQIPVILDC